MCLRIDIVSNRTSLFSFLRQLSTWHCSRLLLSAGRAAIDRYLLTAGPTAANPHQRSAAGKRWNRRTDGRTDGRTDTRPLRRPFTSAISQRVACCLLRAQGQPTATGVLLSVDQSRGTVYLWHCDQVTSRRRLSEDTWRHFCLTVLTIISYVDSYRDIDSYVTILPSLPT